MDIAASTQDRINGTYLEKSGNSFDIIPLEEALPLDDDFLSKASSPARHTLLHKFIESYLEAEYYYASRKYEEDFSSMARDLLEAYGCEYRAVPYSGRESNLKLYEQLVPLFRLLAHDAFGILYKNRELMRDFGRIVAKVSGRNFPRATYWPAWVKDALFHRDNGRCGKCNCDLTGVLSIERRFHIDHMIPISLGGTNDPTNLQVLCDRCNLQKGNRNDSTSLIRHVPWLL
ncbi:HNH endonuclease [Alcaligenes sp. A-TC2]|uniref:HNH endonuclease n=1 Tax=Alcaligenes nematophilus TaxID=2994643 RepID=UPI00224EAD72|nr:HNH endonuclease [Alcaligenes nematophilus]MCX5470459.1 HNH endonuclease [Alcaligenes nematophilus]